MDFSINAQEELQTLLDYNPLTLTTESGWTPESVRPFWFYDKHLDPGLSLSRVERMSSLPKDISDLVNQKFNDAKEKGIELPQINDNSTFTLKRFRNITSTNVNDVRSVARHYNVTTASYCQSVASTLALHPRSPGWMSALMWTQKREPSLCEDSSEGYALRFRYFPETHSFGVPAELISCLDYEIENLQDVTARFPDLATWVMGEVSDESVALLRDMDRVMDSGSFSFEICGTSGGQPNDAIPHHSPDALSNPWRLEEHPNIPDQLPRPSTRLQRPLPSPTKNRHCGSKDQQEPQQGRPTASELVSTTTRKGEILPSMQTDCYSSSTERFLQHAWNRSVQKDTTIIVFHCGNFERIGVRHRKTQTLYLSDLIDVVTCKNPAYGKIHIGLYMAAIEDAIDRTKQLRDLKISSQIPLVPDSPVVLKPKVMRPEGPKKKARIEMNGDESTADNHDDIFHRAALCNLALFRLQYGVFNSPSPASFLRTGRSLSPAIGPLRRPRVKRKYLPHEYLTLTVRPVIGSGTTGTLHEAQLEVIAGDIKLSHDIVAKFAFTAKQQGRMRHEYDIYSHLAAKGVKTNIPDVYGMFEDLEGGGAVLLMSHGGKNLWDCRSIDVPDDFQVKVVEPERTAFLDAISRIHRAGVYHRDIRPNNFLINDAGEITIIDFDNALFNPTKGAMRREYRNLALLLDGEYEFPDGLSTETTNDSAADLSDAPEKL